MIKYKDDCVGCPPGIGCLGSSCPNRNVPYTYCDKCGDEAPVYALNDDDEQLCEECMERELDSIWAGLTFQEKCEIFDIKEVTI